MELSRVLFNRGLDEADQLSDYEPPPPCGAAAPMVVNGVSTRKVSQVMETLCGKTHSKSTVSEACKELDKRVREFRERPLTGEYPFLTVDATYFKVRAFMIAYATNSEGQREIIGFGIYANESKQTWNAFLKSLKDRGLHGVKMITSDAHEGILNAISKIFPEAAWQRCQFHFSRNIIDKMPKKYQKGLSAELQEMFNCKTLGEARKRKDAIIADYNDIAEEAMNCLDEGFESAMSIMVRTSNHIERLNKELKRCSKVIGIFPNEGSLMRLIGSVLVERNEEILSRKCIFSGKTYQALLSTEIPSKLIQIATEQRNLLAA